MTERLEGTLLISYLLLVGGSFSGFTSVSHLVFLLPAEADAVLDGELVGGLAGP